MELRIGEFNTLTVKRITDLGYTLTSDGEDEILMHFKQAGKELEVGEEVSVFLLFDSMKRITATCEAPFIKVGCPGFVKVTDVVKSLGVFINNNVFKDPLISRDDLPFKYEEWPIIGDTVLCKLKATKTKLIAKLVSAEEVKTMFKPGKELQRLEKVEAIVIKNGVSGVNLITLEGHNIFVYYKNRRRDYRVGEQVIVTITYVGENNNYNGSLLGTKVPVMKDDANTILNYLNDNNGTMDFTIKSSVQEIEKTFNMSKAAFKRALGNLYKERKIEFRDNKTYLVK